MAQKQLDLINGLTGSDSCIEWEVKEILDHRFEKGQIWFMLLWSTHHVTWEPEENLSCGVLMMSYISKYRNTFSGSELEKFKSVENYLSEDRVVKVLSLPSEYLRRKEHLLFKMPTKYEA